MHYYRTKQDIQSLSEEFKGSAPNLRFDEMIEKKHNLKRFGLYNSHRNSGFWTTKVGTGLKDDQFKAAPGVLDFIMASGIYSDANKSSGRILIYGRLEHGVVVEVVGLNQDAI